MHHQPQSIFDLPHFKGKKQHNIYFIEFLTEEFERKHPCNILEEIC